MFVYYETVTFFDGDSAGIKGSLLAGEMLEEAAISNHVVEIPEGKDVADLLVSGGLEVITSYTQSAIPFKRFRTFQQLSEMDIVDVQAYMKRLGINMIAVGNI